MGLGQGAVPWTQSLAPAACRQSALAVQWLLPGLTQSRGPTPTSAAAACQPWQIGSSSSRQHCKLSQDQGFYQWAQGAPTAVRVLSTAGGPHVRTRGCCSFEHSARQPAKVRRVKAFDMYVSACVVQYTRSSMPGAVSTVQQGSGSTHSTALVAPPSSTGGGVRVPANPAQQPGRPSKPPPW